MPDQKVINALQVAYDWVFDRTGLPKGTIYQVYALVYFCCRLRYHLKGTFWVLIAALPLMAVASIWNYLQKQNIYRFINALAERVQTESYAYYKRMILLSLSLTSSFSDGWLGAFAFSLVLFSYLMCIKIRDREPPEPNQFFFNPA